MGLVFRTKKTWLWPIGQHNIIPYRIRDDLISRYSGRPCAAYAQRSAAPHRAERPRVATGRRGRAFATIFRARVRETAASGRPPRPHRANSHPVRKRTSCTLTRNTPPVLRHPCTFIQSTLTSSFWLWSVFSVLFFLAATLPPPVILYSITQSTVVGVHTAIARRRFYILCGGLRI